MVLTRSGNGGRRGRGRGGGKVEVRREKTGISKSNPRRSSGRLQAKRAKNYAEVDEDESFSLSASTQLTPSSQLPFQSSQPAPGNLSFNILRYCYTRREGMNSPLGSPRRTPMRVLPQSQDFEKKDWPTFAMGETQPLEDGRPSASCTQGAFEDENNEALHDAFDAEADEATGHEVPIGGDLHGNMLLQNVNHNTLEVVGNVASNHFDNDQGQGGRALNNVPAQLTGHSSKSMNITEMVEQMDDELCDVDSLLGCEADLVSVEGYRVKPHNAEILKTIISKHGDIGANCSLESVALRSLSMELLCKIVLELKASNNILHITEDKIIEMQASICDMERQNIEVGWLKTRLNEMLEAKLAMPILKKSSGVKRLRNEWKAKVKTLTEELHIYGKDIHALQLKMDAAIRELSHAQAEATNADSIISEGRAKLKRMFDLGTLIDDLV